MKKKKAVMLELIAPPVSEVKKHFDVAANKMFSDPSPVVGYAMVTFHENRGFGTSYHTQNIGVLLLDLPEAVKTRLMQSIFKAS